MGWYDERNVVRLLFVFGKVELGILIVFLTIIKRYKDKHSSSEISVCIVDYYEQSILDYVDFIDKIVKLKTIENYRSFDKYSALCDVNYDVVVDCVRSCDCDDEYLFAKFYDCLKFSKYVYVDSNHLLEEKPVRDVLCTDFDQLSSAIHSLSSNKAIPPFDNLDVFVPSFYRYYYALGLNPSLDFKSLISFNTSTASKEKAQKFINESDVAKPTVLILPFSRVANRTLPAYSVCQYIKKNTHKYNFIVVGNLTGLSSYQYWDYYTFLLNSDIKCVFDDNLEFHIDLIRFSDFVITAGSGSFELCDVLEKGMLCFSAINLKSYEGSFVPVRKCAVVTLDLHLQLDEYVFSKYAEAAFLGKMSFCETPCTALKVNYTERYYIELLLCKQVLKIISEVHLNDESLDAFVLLTANRKYKPMESIDWTEVYTLLEQLWSLKSFIFKADISYILLFSYAAYMLHDYCKAIDICNFGLSFSYNNPLFLNNICVCKYLKGDVSEVGDILTDLNRVWGCLKTISNNLQHYQNQRGNLLTLFYRKPNINDHRSVFLADSNLVGCDMEIKKEKGSE